MTLKEMAEECARQIVLHATELGCEMPAEVAQNIAGNMVGAGWVMPATCSRCDAELTRPVGLCGRCSWGVGDDPQS